MNEKTQHNIFDKFYQGDTSHSSEGNGLGLPLVKKIVELHHGSITVKSHPGQGSLFTVTLPIIKSSHFNGQVLQNIIDKMQLKRS